MADSFPDQRRRRKQTLVWTVAVTLVVESITVAIRFGTGVSAVEFNKTDPPLLLQMHHMFWGVPLLIALPFLWRFERISSAVLGIVLGLILSDLAHHFLVLPLTVGNTGWHWP